MDFKRLIAMTFTVGSLTIAGCPDDTPMAVDTDGSSGSSDGGDDGDPTITTGISTAPSTMSAGDDTTGSPTTDPGTTGDDGGTGDCCSTHPSTGCEDAACSTAVCDMNASCCAFEWNSACVDLAERLCDGCTGGTMGSDGTDGGSSSDDGGTTDQCCTATPGVPGCANELLEDCVCTQDAFCCDNEWDGMCVGAAIKACGADCPAMEGDCCAAGNGPGCMDDDCEAAVCAVDDYCCGTEWDGLCAGAAAGICEICGAEDGDCCTANGMQGCNDDQCIYNVCDNFGNPPMIQECCTQGWTQDCADLAGDVCEVCGGGVDPDDCCAANGGTGCGDQSCEDAVCAVDPFCCGSSWDENCAAEAAGICSVCGAADGECCGPTGTQGCNDDSCVASICGYGGFDPDCCTNGWTQACANAAADSCEVCGAVIPNGCCEANGTPGCDDPTCEAAICDVDPVCCSMGWDSFCAAEALGFCDVCGGGMGNCCEDNGSAGCNDAQCVVDICGFDGGPVDQTCCTDTWDAACGTAAMTAGCVCNP